MRRPETHLAALATLVVALVADSYRDPAFQCTGRLFVLGVHLYQASGRPLLEGRIRCRYTPTCSEYSIQAVREYGIREGLMLTVNRLNSCTTDVPLGTQAPLPLRNAQVR